MSAWRLTPRGTLAVAGVTGRRHVLSRSSRTAVTVFENERNAILHSSVLGDAEMTPAEAVVRIAVHHPDVFEAWRA